MSAQQLERERLEGEIAIEMVARGAAVRVSLANLRYAGRLASSLAQVAAQARVEFRVEDAQGGPPFLIVGPRRDRAARDQS